MAFIRVRIRRPERDAGSWSYQVEDHSGGANTVFRGRGPNVESARNQALSKARERLVAQDRGDDVHPLSAAMRRRSQKHDEDIDDSVPF